ncbi:MAG: GNAT family N-acetyltransferase [Pseudomonadota bacterium]
MSLTVDQMADLHARSFAVPRPWSADEFRTLLTGPGIIDLREPRGFLLGRVLADEAELLTLCIEPEARRLGLGCQLVRQFIEHAEAQGAATAFLEVAADNLAATALYSTCGFAEVGRRKSYYGETDALVMARALSAEKTV